MSLKLTKEQREEVAVWIFDQAFDFYGAERRAVRIVARSLLYSVRPWKE